MNCHGANMSSKCNDDIEGLLRVVSGRYNGSAVGQERTDAPFVACQLQIQILE